MPSTDAVHVIGGGLAGSEAAYQLGVRGIPVVLHEMRPQVTTAAHTTGQLAELVCSNTLGSRMPHTAPGVFKGELAVLGSLIVAAGEAAHVPAGGALAVDRDVFSRTIAAVLAGLPAVSIELGEVREIPPGRTIVATGPLTSDALAAQIQAWTGSEDLYFYDAIAPIVDSGSVDMTVAFWANRYEDPDDSDGDYLNLPMDRGEYEGFIDALLAAEQVPSKDFEPEHYFSGCQPIEAIAGKGRESLRFGPMKPVGLTDPRTGRRAHAVVQLRRETRQGTAMNLVGFQTKLRYGAQTEVFRRIPGLGDAEFLRLGSVHRNTFLNTPRLLDRALRLKTEPRISFAGQITGCEGYTESSAMGLWAALNVAAEREGRTLVPPPVGTMFGGLLDYLAHADPKGFQPMNVNFGLLPEETERVRKRDKKERRVARGEEAVRRFALWAHEQGVAHRAPGLPAPHPALHAPAEEGG